MTKLRKFFSFEYYLIYESSLSILFYLFVALTVIGSLLNTMVILFSTIIAMVFYRMDLRKLCDKCPDLNIFSVMYYFGWSYVTLFLINLI